MDITITLNNGTKQIVSGSSLTISPSQVTPPPPPPSGVTLVPGTKISQGMTGKFYVGLNCHNTPPNIAGLISGLGGNTVRMTPFYRGQQLNWPGTDAGEQVILQTARDAVALGFQPLMTVTDYFIASPTDARWSDFVRQVVTQTPGCIYECENEPNFNVGGVSPQRYFHCLELTRNAMKAVNPNAKLAAPCTNASYVAANQSWCAQLMAIPGFWNLIDIWSSHPYNQTPETSWANDTNSVINRVLANLPANHPLTFMNSEQGWVARAGEGHGDPSEGYSKVPFMQRASRRYSHSIFYAVYDDAFGDVGTLNKAWSPIVTDAFKRVRAATDASMYVRESAAGNYNTDANWYVRTQVPEGQELCCWSVPGTRNARIVVDSPTAGNMWTRMVGGANVAIPVVAGRQAISVTLFLRARLLGGNNVTFPEFAS